MDVIVCHVESTAPSLQHTTPSSVGNQPSACFVRLKPYHSIAQRTSAVTASVLWPKKPHGNSRATAFSKRRRSGVPPIHQEEWKEAAVVHQSCCIVDSLGQLLLQGDLAGRGLFMRAQILEETSEGKLFFGLLLPVWFARVGLVTPLVDI